MAICLLGPRYDWAIQTSSRQFQVHVRAGRQVSKWIEYMPLVKATSEKAVEFLNQIIHHFGIPNSIITDLGTQFTSTTF